MNCTHKPITTVGIAPNPIKPEATSLACGLAALVLERGAQPLLLDKVAADCSLTEFSASEDALAHADLLLVLGGDGTMLRWCRIASPHGALMLGVNFGRYGFITEVTPESAIQAVSRVLAGDYCISERVMLEAEVVRAGKSVFQQHALNEVVVSKGPLSRMLSLRTYANEKFLVTYRADGIIVSSPTGSTAYSLAAGGPVVHPDVNVLIITPICPHTLNERSLVVPDVETVRIIGEGQETGSDTMLTMDGQLGEHLLSEDVVIVRKAEFKARLVQTEAESFYNKLRTRLRWGERFDEPREEFPVSS